MNKTKKDWLFAFILTAPMIIFYARHFISHSSWLNPTGFIAYDNVSYIAYAKQYLDADNVKLLYSNPLNDSGNYTGIYFQTQNIFFILLLALGIPPGIVLVVFNCLCTMLSFRMVISIYDHLIVEKQNRKLFISFFCWGGGLLAIAGIPIALINDGGNLDFLDRIFYIDPAWGWWGLNFGRGHFMSSEGYFHFLFLSAILCILKKKWILALVVTTILSLSHPFTGFELVAIIAVWGGVEKFLLQRENPGWSFFTGILLILAFHIFYYLYYLNQFPEHKSLSEQYSLNWRLRFFNMIPAWFIVGALAVFSFIKFKTALFKNENNRLFLCWFLVALILANHELFIKPMQPIHFTRGYIWASLFLLGLPALQKFFQHTKTTTIRFLQIFFIILMFSDNFLWIGNYVRNKASSASTSYITDEQKNLLKVLNQHSTNQTLIIGNDNILTYLSIVHTKAYPWVSHPYTTPYYAKKIKAYEEFIFQNKIDSAWADRDVIFIFRKNIPEEFARSNSMPFYVELIANSPSYIIQKVTIPRIVQ